MTMLQKSAPNTIKILPLSNGENVILAPERSGTLSDESIAEIAEWLVSEEKT